VSRTAVAPAGRTRLAAPHRGWLFGLLAAALLFPLFHWGHIGPLDFWWWMSATQLVLVLVAYGTDAGARRAAAADLRTGLLRKISLGLLSAAVLYVIFWAGNQLVRELLPRAVGGIASLYSLKGGAGTARVALLIGLVIGPGEELVWRGVIQRAFTAQLGAVRGLLAATGLYAVVHLSSGNPMLILAALVCGLFWGLLYQRTSSIALVVISHTAWDLVVFLVAPFT
jgi:hypothetical protein